VHKDNNLQEAYMQSHVLFSDYKFISS